MPDQHDRELQIIESVADAPPLKKFGAYAKLSGPGWLQGAITLGGGSLAGALYMGIISGYGLMWLQPLAMICGIIMLSAIAYVTLATEQKPFQQINRNLSPLLGYSWIFATILANIVWCMPQFALATGAIQQNLFSASVPKGLIVAVLLGIGLYVNFLYEAGAKGIKVFDNIIKVMVAIIVLSFFLVVVTLSKNGALPWGEILSGYLPDFSLLNRPASVFNGLIEQSSNSAWWNERIIGEQKDRIFTAFGTAVGINMTWLLPYTLLKKRWGAKHRGLSIVDLSIGLFIPFFLATSCVVIAAASQFHGKVDDVLLADGTPRPEMVKVVEKTLKGLESPTQVDIELAAMLVSRDSFALATTLEPLAGEAVSQKIFGVGVLGMAVSTIIILMLMNGIAFRELLAKQTAAAEAKGGSLIAQKWPYFLGCLIAGGAGSLGPFVWGGAAPYLAVPTSVIGGALIPIAYFTFLLLMNSKKVLGDKRPEGKARIIWNTLMITATTIATFGSIWAIHGKKLGSFPAGMLGVAFLVILFVVGLFSFLKHEKEAS
ncbi:divalent metal cation transporter [Roseibacillus persicicus]|uniref:divalent metal cation transporter n=1 Tax=Roseibacillus persicicus TaxID=454148 RepID=UPI00398B872F